MWSCNLQVLVTDLTKEWPAQKTWNLKQMVDRYGDVAFKVSQSHGKKVKMKLKDYASYMQSQNDEEPLYIFDSKVSNDFADYWSFLVSLYSLVLCSKDRVL